MALSFVKEKTTLCLGPLLKSSDQDSVLQTKIIFNPSQYLDDNFRQTYVIFQEITRINREMMFKYFMEEIEKYVRNFLDTEKISVGCYKALLTLFTLTHYSFQELDTDEDFISDDKTLLLIDIWLQLSEKVFGLNLDTIVSCYAQMLLTISAHSANFYDGLTKNFQWIFTNKFSSSQFKANIKPWIILTNDMKRLLSFLKVLTTSLTLASSSYYKNILDTITKIIMNVINKSSAEYKKYLDSNQASETANNVSKMIAKWDVKPASTMWITQFALLLIQTNQISIQERNIDIPFLKSIMEVKEIKSSTDFDALKAILNGFAAINRIGPQPTMVLFMKKFINIPLNFLKTIFKKPKDIPGNINFMMTVDFPNSLLYISIDLFNTYYAEPMMATNALIFWEMFANIVKRACEFTKDQPYSFRGELTALVPLFIKMIDLLIENKEKMKKSISTVIEGCASNPFFCRLVFVEHPEVYGKVMKMMKSGEFTGVDKLNLALFDLSYVDDIQGPNFWEMLSILLSTYISLSRTIKFLGSSMFAKVPVILERAMMFVDAFIKNSEKDKLPSTGNWEKILNQIEEILLLFLTRINLETGKSTLVVISAYLYFITLRPVNQDNMIIEQLRALVDCDPLYLHKVFAIAMRNQTLPPLIQKSYDYFNSLFVSICKDFIPSVPTGNTKAEKIKETSLDAKKGIWIATMSICTALNREIREDRYELYRIFLKEQTNFGSKMPSILAYSLPMRFSSDLLDKMKTWIHSDIENHSIENIPESTQLIATNIMKYIINFNKRDDLDEFSYKGDSISYIFADLAHFANVSHKMQTRISFCEMTVSLITILNKFNQKLFPMHRFVAAKNMLQWIPPDQNNDPQIQTICLKAIEAILNGLSFFETTDPVGDKAKAAENFTLFFTFIKQGANSHSGSIKEMLAVLTAIMRENFYIGINSCIAMGYDDDPKVRTAFLNGLSAFFSPEVYQLIVTAEMQDDIIDLLMGGNFDLVKLLALKMPYNKTEEFGKELIQAAAYKSREFEFFQAMIELELATQTISNNVEEINRTKLFRGNGTPSKVFSAYAHMVGHQWLCDCIIPIIQKIVQKVNEGYRFQIDAARLQPGENIVKNRESFRIAFIEMTDMFAAKLNSLPTGLIKAAQMLYKSVVNQSQKVASQSIASFIFLRFVCPTLPEPTKVGYTDAIDENVRTCLIHLSTLLMVAAVHPKVDPKRQYYALFNEVVGIAYTKFQTAYSTIANMRITDVPLVTTIDPSSVTTALHSLLFPLISTIQTEVASRGDEELSKSADNLIQKLREMGTLASQKEEVVVQEENISSLDKLMHTKVNEALLLTLRNVLYKVNQKTRNGEDIFYLNLPAYVKKYPAVYLARHVFMLLKGYESAKYVIIADCGGFDIGLLPSVKEMKDLAKIVPNYIINNIAAIFVIRLQSNLVKFINDTRFLHSLPKVKCLSTMEEFRNLVCQQTGFLSDIAVEALAIPDSVHTLEVNGCPATINVMQKSIQIRMNNNIGYDILTNDVIRLLELEDHIIVSTKGMHSFITLTDERGISYVLKMPKTSDFPIVLKQIKIRDNLVKTTRNLIYVEKPSLHMLLLNVALLNLVSDQSDYNVRQASLVLIAKTLECTGMKHALRPTDFSSASYAGSVNEVAYKISDDIARNNPEDVHKFILEFVKTMTYLNQNDFSIISAFIAPWMIHCGNEAIRNKATLDAIAQIAAAIPVGDTMQFTEEFWSAITDESLFHTLLLKSAEFGNSSFISLFLPISYKSPQISRMLAECINNEQSTASFVNAAKTLVSLVIADTLDVSVIPLILHSIFCSLFIDRADAIIHLFRTIYGKYVGDPKEITNDLVAQLPPNPVQDYYEQTKRVAKLAGFISEIINVFPQLREEFIGLMINDTESENPIVSYIAFVFIGVSCKKDDLLIEYTLFAQLHNTEVKSISFISQAISLLDLSETNAYLVFCAGIFLLAFAQQSSTVDMIIRTLRSIAKTKNLNKLNLADNVMTETVNYVGQVLGLPLLDDPLYSLIAVAFSQNKHEKVIKELIDLGVSNDLIEGYKFNPSSIDKLKRSKFSHEIALMTLYKFIEDPKDLCVIYQLNEMIDAHQEYFCGIPQEKLLTAAASSKVFEVSKLLCSFVRCHLYQNKASEVPYFSNFINNKKLGEVPAECISPMLDGLFGKMF